MNSFENVKYEEQQLTLEQSLDELAESVKGLNELIIKVNEEEIKYLKQCVAYEKIRNARGW